MRPIRTKPDIWQMVFQEGNTFQLSADEILGQSLVEYSKSQLQKVLKADTYKYFSGVLEAIDNGGIPNIILASLSNELFITSY